MFDIIKVTVLTNGAFQAQRVKAERQELPEYASSERGLPPGFELPPKVGITSTIFGGANKTKLFEWLGFSLADMERPEAGTKGPTTASFVLETSAGCKLSIEIRRHDGGYFVSLDRPDERPKDFEIVLSNSDRPLERIALKVPASILGSLRHPGYVEQNYGFETPAAVLDWTAQQIGSVPV